MITFQVLDPVVDHFDLFLHNRHTLCEVVVFSDLSGQLVHFRFHYSLGLIVGNQDSQQGNAAGNNGGKNSTIHRNYTPSSFAQVMGPTTPSTSRSQAFWNAFTAPSVTLPKSASAP